MNNRRSFLKLAGITGLTTIATLKGAQALESCDFRPSVQQPLGPFYPKQFPLDKDVDLTQVSGNRKKAIGERVIVTGIITDEYCRPVKGAIVEIWQACHSGKYNHPSDTSDNPLDPDFQYYGTMKTDSDGRYTFKTIRPGSYQASDTWRRPPHIHYKVSLRGYQELVTQLYFAGDELNRYDQILQRLHKADQQKVTVTFEKKVLEGQSVLYGQFDLTLQKV
jgi:protocatechuate 3,4-dioxygenase, beta subunit